MARFMKWAAVFFFLLTAAFIGLSFCNKWALPFAITFGTCFYHFAMRLLVGHLVNHRMRNKAVIANLGTSFVLSKQSSING